MSFQKKFLRKSSASTSRVRFVDEDYCPYEKPLNHGEYEDDDCDYEADGTVYQRRFQKAVTKATDAFGDRAQAQAACMMIHIMQGKMAHWQELYKSQLNEAEMKEYCKVRLMMHYSKDDVSTMPRDAFLALVKQNVDVKHYDADYLRANYSGLYDLIVSKTQPVYNEAEFEKAWGSVATKMKGPEYAALMQDLVDNRESMAVIKRAIDENVGAPAFMADILTRSLDHLSVSWHTKVCTGKVDPDAENFEEIFNPLEIPFEGVSTVDAIDYDGDENFGVDIAGITHDDVLELEKKPRPKFFYTDSEEKAKDFLVSYVELRAGKDYDPVNAPSKVFLGHKLSGEGSVGFRVGIGRNKIRVPSYIARLYRHLGIVPGISFWMDRVMTQSLVKNLILMGAVSPRYSGFRDKKEIDPSSLKLETQKISTIGSDVFKLLATNKGKSDTWKLMGYTDEQYSAYVQYCQTFGKNSAHTPSRTVTGVLQDAKMRGEFVTRPEIVAKFMEKHHLAEDVATVYVDMSMIKIAGALVFTPGMGAVQFNVGK